MPSSHGHEAWFSADGVVRFTFGAKDVMSWANELDIWGPHVEHAIQTTLREVMEVEVHVQQLAAGGTGKLQNIATDFKTEVKVSASTIHASDENMCEQLPTLIAGVHDDIVEVDTMVTATAASPSTATPAMQGPWAAATAVAGQDANALTPPASPGLGQPRLDPWYRMEHNRSCPTLHEQRTTCTPSP
jgi:hypothetical protein